MSLLKLVAPLCLFFLALALSAQAQNLVTNGDWRASDPIAALLRAAAAAA